MVPSDPLLEPARAYVVAVLKRVAEHCPGPEDRDIGAGPARWIPAPVDESGVRMFTLGSEVLSALRVCAMREVSRLRHVQEYGDLESALASDPVIAPRLGQLVGSMFLGHMQMDPADVIERLPFIVLERSTSLSFSKEAFFSAFTDWASDLRRTEEKIVVIGVLDDFSTEKVPLDIGDGMVIDELNDAEIELALGMGVLRPPFAERGSAMVERVFGIRGSFVTEFGIAPVDSAAPVVSSRRDELVQRIDEVLLALRVFRAGGVRFPGTITYATGWTVFGGAWSSGGPGRTSPRWIRGPLYSLGSDEHAAFAEFVQALRRARSNRLIDAATRRFGYAADRERPDDEIVDLVVAAETLFLGELGRPSDRGEMRFRLATRAASLVELEGVGKSQLASFMRRAYDARSSIVHGGDLDEHVPRDFDGSRLTANAFADRVEDVVRRALKKTIVTVAAGESYPPDWDQLLFPPGSPS